MANILTPNRVYKKLRKLYNKYGNCIDGMLIDKCDADDYITVKRFYGSQMHCGISEPEAIELVYALYLCKDTFGTCIRIFDVENPLSSRNFF